MGKSLPSKNAMALREPTAAPAAAPAGAAAPAPAESVTAESLGWQLRAALPPLRLHSVSLYDRSANVLWLSEGALGPDEHNLALEAMEALAANLALPCYENGMEDGRVGIFLPVRAPKGDLVGLAMILADLKSVGEGVLERMVTPQVRTLMHKIAVLLRGSLGKSGGETGLVPVIELDSDVSSASPSSEPLGSARARTGTTVLSPQAVDDILEFEMTPDVPLVASHRPEVDAPAEAQQVPTLMPAGTASPGARPHVSRSGGTSVVAALTVPERPVEHSAHPSDTTGERVATTAGRSDTTGERVAATANAALSVATAPNPTGTSRALPSSGATTGSRVLSGNDAAQLLLELQPYAKLRSGGRSRRFEVHVRTPRGTSRDSAALDAHALQRLLSWLSAHRGAWNLEPTSFTLNLSITTLEDERFPQNVASALKSHGIAPEAIGFEIAEPLCMQRRAQVERFIALCDKIGCFIVIDDFSLDSAVLPLLRSKALRLVKIDPRLTGVALKDKLSQALVVAIAQAVKVLGIHCSAKRVDSQSSLQWLSAIGCDFAQGSAVSPLQPLEALLSPPAQ